MKFPAFLVFFAHFLDIFSVKVMCQVPDDLIPELYSKYLDAVNSDEPQPSLRRVFYHNKEYNIHVQQLKKVNGLKNHNLKIKVIGRNGTPPELFYINNPLEAKIPKAFLTLEEFKEVLQNRVNYKSTTQKVVMMRNRNIDSTIIKPNETTTMRSLKLVRANYKKIVKGIPVSNSTIPLTVVTENVRTSPVKEGTLRMNKVIKKDKDNIDNVTTANTFSIKTTEDLAVTEEVTAITEEVTTPNKVEDTTLDESTADSNLLNKEDPDEKGILRSGSETTTNNTLNEIDATTDEVPTEGTESFVDVETSTKMATRRSSLSRPLVYELNDKLKSNGSYE